MSLSPLVQIQRGKQTGKKYWRSLEQLAETSAFREWLHREFPAGASEFYGTGGGEAAVDGPSRRNLLKLMAASFGLAGMTACRRPVEHLLPNSKGVEDYIPGKPFFYNTAMPLGSAAMGVMVEVNDGRPTKIEGNPDHPFSLGAATPFHQASILGVYDPDRLRTPRQGPDTKSWDDFASFAKDQFAPVKLGAGDGLRFLSESVISPSLAAVRDAALAKYPKAKWIEYDSILQPDSFAGSQLAFGQNVVSRYHFDKADVILSLDSDFLGLDKTSVLPIKEFSKKRRVSSTADEMNRLYAVESLYSITGMMADHRLRLPSSQVRDFAADLAAQLGAGGNELKAAGANKDENRAKWLRAIAKDLTEHKGKSIVIAGSRQPAEVHALAHLLNAALGNVGQTVTYLKATSVQTRPQIEALKELNAELAAGQVSHLVILSGNPGYTAPADLDLPANIKNARQSVYLGIEHDETAGLASWMLPEAHYLESWSDALAPDGTASIVQPAIAPLYEGKTAAELVALLTGYKDQRPYDIVRNYWLTKFGKDGEKTWRKSVHDGVIAGTGYAAVTPTADSKRINAAIQGSRSASGFEIVFLPSSSTYDGRFANNGWLQETPDPITKINWDNAALMSAATARQLGVENGSMITIERTGRRLDAPVAIVPGTAENTIGIALGYGRSECGHVGQGVGFDSYKIRTSDALGFAADATVKKGVGTYTLAHTQDHFTIDALGMTEEKRRAPQLIREATLEEFKKEPKFVKEYDEHPPLVTLYGDFDYSHGHQWGMSIDLNSCVGCGACTVACQAENNIPIVGKDQVIRGREMHWIRVDRYFEGNDEDPEIVTQPIACMHCENAPCENVCPVAATAHSPEGLNDMAYNRCVGTRYCSNNCPYKVRRFNFLNWHYGTPDVEKLKYNPDVTVRMRGVMEKCTYCVQRIQETKITAKVDGRRAIRDGEILTACQQTCPADAIVFGDINDPNSRVAQIKKQDRDYALLEELNIRPRTTYLAKLRNPNPELETHHG